MVGLSASAGAGVRTASADISTMLRQRDFMHDFAIATAGLAGAARRRRGLGKAVRAVARFDRPPTMRREPEFGELRPIGSAGGDRFVQSQAALEEERAVDPTRDLIS